MSIRTWDYHCDGCGADMADVPYEGRRPKTIKCACGARAGWGFVVKNQIHQTHSGRKYGKFDPQYGCVVEDYGHRQQLLRESGRVELPPETHEEIAEDIYKQESKKTIRDPKVLIADSLEELNEKMIGKIDTRHTGERQINRLMRGDLIDSGPGIEPTA